MKENDLKKFFSILTNKDFPTDEATNALWKDYLKVRSIFKFLILQEPNIHTNHKLRKGLVPKTEHVFNQIYNYNSSGILLILEMRNKILVISTSSISNIFSN